MEFLAVLSGVGTFAQLAGISYKLFKKARKMVKNMLSAEKEVRDLAEELYDYAKLLDLIEDAMAQFRGTVRQSSREAQFESSQLEKAKQVLGCSARLLDDLDVLVLSSPSSVMSKWIARYRWAVRKQKAEISRYLLLSSKCNLSLLVTMAYLKSLIALLQNLRHADSACRDALLKTIKSLDNELKAKRRKAKRILAKYRKALHEYTIDLSEMPSAEEVAGETFDMAREQLREDAGVLRDDSSSSSPENPVGGTFPPRAPFPPPSGPRRPPDGGSPMAGMADGLFTHPLRHTGRDGLSWMNNQPQGARGPDPPYPTGLASGTTSKVRTRPSIGYRVRGENGEYYEGS